MIVIPIVYYFLCVNINYLLSRTKAAVLKTKDFDEVDFKMASQHNLAIQQGWNCTHTNTLTKI